MTTPETLLIFRIAGIPCAVPAESVGSIVMPPAHLTHPPGSSKSTPGIFHHAEFTYSVLDLHARFGIDEPRKGVGRLLLQNEGIRHFAFLVDEVVGLVRSEEGKWANLPPYLPHSIFWSGFLYRKEIVLCTELGALRTMHDAEPLRRHIEALRQQAELSREQEPAAESTKPKVETHKDKPRSKETTEAAAPRAQVTHTPPPASTSHRPSAEQTEKKEPARPAPPASRPVPNVTPKVPARTAPAATTTVARETPKPPLPAATEKTPQSTRPSRRKAVSDIHHESPKPAAPVESFTPPVTPTSPPTSKEEDRTSLLPLVMVFLLLLLILPLGYWLWFQPEQATVYPSFNKNSSQDNSLAVKPVEPVTPPPAAKPAVATADEKPAPTPTSEASANVDETSKKPTTSSPAPLTIERDGKGTINLIIDRQAIANSTTARVPLLSSPKTGDGDVATGTEKATAEDAAATAKPEQVKNEEEPLKPGPDWPHPSNPTGLEPCDCTHIVVPGDTLWDIAEKYTGNAFNYHDLARRSGIHNPDKIYPGDTVRIIIR